MESKDMFIYFERLEAENLKLSKTSDSNYKGSQGKEIETHCCVLSHNENYQWSFYSYI